MIEEEREFMLIDIYCIYIQMTSVIACNTHDFHEFPLLEGTGTLKSPSRKCHVTILKSKTRIVWPSEATSLFAI